MFSVKDSSRSSQPDVAEGAHQLVLRELRPTLRAIPTHPRYPLRITHTRELSDTRSTATASHPFISNFAYARRTCNAYQSHSGAGYQFREPATARVLPAMSEVLLGTCGWSYAEWDRILYPQKQGKLKQYASIFRTAEIDSTFYRLPEAGTVLGWTRQTPPDFKFSTKLPQTITHKKALDVARGIEADINQFLETMKPLTDVGKLTCVLVQLPPFLRFNAERFESFLTILPDKPAFAVEFRHTSWLNGETLKLLEKYRVAYTIVDEPLLPPEVHVTSDLAYVRWHGRGDRPWFNYKYSEDQLTEWVPKVQEAAGKAGKVLGYFNNHFHGYAPENCLQIMEMLGVVTPHGSAALRRVRLRAREREVAADSEILEAARSISERDLSLREDTRRCLAAYVGATTVDVDLEQHTIIHRCPIWAKSISEKKFCPHVARVFMIVDPARARSILSLLRSTLDDWKFESKLTVELPK